MPRGRRSRTVPILLLGAVLAAAGAARPVLADGDLARVGHILIVMQENHSFDNYFGVLPYVPGGPYHPAPGLFLRRDGCDPHDHACVDGLRCLRRPAGGLVCFDSNLDQTGARVFAFHDQSFCVDPDLDHSWVGTHREINYLNPRASLTQPRQDGFVRVNDGSGAGDRTMGYHDQDDLPFYYGLAQRFAIGDRYFASVPGPTFPNRSYLMAATSFGHLSTNDTVPPPGGYQPIAGTIFDRLDAAGVSWGDYYQDWPQGASFRPFGFGGTDPHFHPLRDLLDQLAGDPGAPPLPAVVLVDPSFGVLGRARENDEHPPTDIRRGQAFVSRVANALRDGPYWPDSILILTYDEHGGFYDHVPPPPAPQGGLRSPDGIAPGQCADLSDPPASLLPGGGARCAENILGRLDTSVKQARRLCPALLLDPTGSYPASCPDFDQLGVRVPFVAVSPFSKPAYVSHRVADHTSILALIEARFLPGPGGDRAHLTARDQHASALEDLFDFDAAPSRGAAVGSALPPADDCTP